jgi:hypothetical protein
MVGRTLPVIQPYLLIAYENEYLLAKLQPHHHHHHHSRSHHMPAINVSVGHTVNFAILYLDQDGNPMLTPPTPDAAPTWSDTTPATGTLTPSGSTASELIIAAGSDTVSVTVAVGGVTFSASQQLVAAAAQKLTSIQIQATVV